jgi:hypothetical protein
MSDRFPPLRPQVALTDTARHRAHTAPAPVDLTLMAALVLVVAVALV